MLVNRKNNSFKATQWFKDGDHPAVYYHKERPGLAMKTGNYVDESNEELPTHIAPGDWVIEIFNEIQVYEDDEFHNMFVEENHDNSKRNTR